MAIDTSTLPPEITGAGGVLPLGTQTPQQIAAANELAARQEEARAFQAIEARKDPAGELARQRSLSHRPGDVPPQDLGAAPAIPLIPPAGAPTTPAVAPAVRPAARSAKPGVAPTAALTGDQEKIAAAEAGQTAAMAEGAQAEADALDAEAELRNKQANEIERERRLQELDRNDADQKIATLREEASKAKFTSFSADKTVIQDVMMGIGAILGGVSFSEHHTNQSIAMIDKAMDRHMKQEEARHANLWRSVDAAVSAGKMLREDQLTSMATIRFRQAAAIDAVIAKSKQMMALSKNKEAIKAIEANNKRLEFQRDHVIADTRRLFEMSAETRRHNMATEAISREHNEIARDKGVDSKTEARTVRDPVTGEALGLAPTARDVTKLASTMSKISTYEQAVYKFAEHIEKHGHLFNKFSDVYKERESLAADVQAMGRPIKEIQGTDAGAKLEHAVIGGSGTGTTRAADPKVLRHLAQQARQQVNERLRASLAPMPGEAASKSLSGGGGQPHGSPVAAPSGYTDTGRTKGGKPVFKDAAGNLFVGQ